MANFFDPVKQCIKILNFCSIDPRVEDEEGLEHHSKSDEKIFMEFFSNPEKINELPTMYKMITKKNCIIYFQINIPKTLCCYNQK